MTKQIYPALTGVRALAAYMVFLHHYNPFNETDSALLHKFVGRFHIGVSIFFCVERFSDCVSIYGRKKFPFRSLYGK